MDVVPDSDNERLQNDLLHRLTEVDNPINNILYAIHRAKNGIVNLTIISRDEMEVALQQIKKPNQPYATVEQAFNCRRQDSSREKRSIIHLGYPNHPR